jgi:predicted nucleic acid-binding protein
VRYGVLADAGPLYAALDPNDRHYRRARRELERLEDDRQIVALPYPTLAETHALVLRRLGRETARRLLASVSTGTATVNPEPPDYRDAIALLDLYLDQEITIFDAVLAVLSRRLETPVWTYDHDFDVMGVEVWR